MAEPTSLDCLRDWSIRQQSAEIWQERARSADVDPTTRNACSKVASAMYAEASAAWARYMAALEAEQIDRLDLTDPDHTTAAEAADAALARIAEESR